MVKEKRIFCKIGFESLKKIKVFKRGLFTVGNKAQLDFSAL